MVTSLGSERLPVLSTAHSRNLKQNSAESASFVSGTRKGTGICEDMVLHNAEQYMAPIPMIVLYMVGSLCAVYSFFRHPFKLHSISVITLIVAPYILSTMQFYPFDCSISPGMYDLEKNANVLKVNKCIDGIVETNYFIFDKL